MTPVPVRFLSLTIALLVGVARFSFAQTSDPPAPYPVNEAAQRMTVTPGFEVTLFAGEPDVVQPIAMTTDDRGRLWVVECLSYPTWSTNAQGNDRVVVFEDTNGDGHFDKRHVFLEHGRNLSGIAVGFGGVWLLSAPELIFVPDRNQDDIPDGPPEVMLDGWTLDAKHNIVNGLNWGPDGWLYGCHGILATSKVGRPGTPDSERVTLNCSVWRFHPTRHQFEVVARGMTNPWGISFNDYGQGFVANCVIKHLFHIIPGARFERMYGQDDNPYSFRLMASCADHIHWAGGFWKTEGAGGPQNDAAGGGHAHCGALVYLGDNWPDQYRNTFFTLNVHGHRINNDLLERRGSGYVGRHHPDLVKANDPWFRGVSLVPAADGSVFMSDWCDAGECHDYDDIHRENGRIYRVSYGHPHSGSRNLRDLPDTVLVHLQLEKNDWMVSHARLLLQERAAAGTLDAGTRPALLRMLRKQTDVTRQLRALWALHVTGGLEPQLVDELLHHSEEWIRAWTVQLTLDSEPPPPGLPQKLAELAAQDPSALVRRYLASALQRLPLAQRQAIAVPLLAHLEDAGDQNIPFLLWYGIEPLASADAAAGAALLEAAKIPLVRQCLSQRLALRDDLAALSKALDQTKEGAEQADIVRGMFEALNGRRNLPAPPDWSKVSAKLQDHPDPEVRDQALRLSLIFNEPAATEAFEQRLSNPQLSAAARQSALQALVQAKSPGLTALLQKLVSNPTLRGVALRGLAASSDPSTAAVILTHYNEFTRAEKAEAINTLASRPNDAIALLNAVKAGEVPSRDISPFAARQMQALKDPRIAPLIAEALGQVRAIDQDKAAEIARFKALLTPTALKQANLSHGRAEFTQTCAPCHTLFDAGGKVGPELTGAQRSSLDYLLENVVDPNAVVFSQYHATYFETRDDQLITGIVQRENESTVTIQTQTGTLTLPRQDITSRRESNLSLMPEGLLESLPSTADVVDLIAYLQSPVQVSLPAGSEKR